MASLTMLFSLLLIASSFVYPSKGAVSQDILKNICAKTDNHQRCIETLKFDPRTSNLSDVRDLLPISIEMAQNQTTYNLHVYQALYSNATDGSSAEESFRICMDYYVAIETKLIVIHKLSTRQHYPEISPLYDVKTFVADCSHNIDITPPPFDKINNAMYFKTQVAIAVNKYIKQ
ncbi:hypothetical protein ACFE04_022524 [Oxalis oulophora]